MKRFFLTGALVNLILASVISAQGDSYAQLGGGRVELSSHRGGVVVLAVGAYWLPFAKGQAETLSSLRTKHRAESVHIYFILTDRAETTDAALTEFARDSKLTVPILRDPKGILTERLFKPGQMPAYIVIGKDGKVVGKALTGFDTKSDMVPVLNKLIETGLGQ